MFVNVSNHPVSQWSEEQKKAAETYGEIVEIPFPVVDPGLEDSEMNKVIDSYFIRISSLGEVTAMVQGEFVFTYRLVNRLKAAGILVVAASSWRKTVEKPGENGSVIKTSEFVFAGFREY